jgi:hypothetical protein
MYYAFFRWYQLNTEEKEQLKVWIPASCMQRLRRYISRKKGWLSIEVENFINQGIAAFNRQTAEEKHTHTSTPQRDEILLLKGRLIAYLGLENEVSYDRPSTSASSMTGNGLDSLTSSALDMNSADKEHWNQTSLTRIVPSYLYHATIHRPVTKLLSFDARKETAN